MSQANKPSWPSWAEYSIPVKINVQAVQLTDEQFVLLCQENPELRLELTAAARVGDYASNRVKDRLAE